MIVSGDRAYHIERFIAIEGPILERNWASTPNNKKKITIEPPTAKDVEEVEVQIGKIMGGESPLTAKVVCTVKAKMKPQSLHVVKTLRDKYGIQPLSVARTGACHLPGFPTKRFGAWVKQKKALIYEVPAVWNYPEWETEGIPRLLTMLEDYRDRTLYNIERGDNEPQLLIGEKEPNTGTGLIRGSENRGLLAESIRYRRAMFETMVTDYYNDLIELIRGFPKVGGIVHVNEGFHGIFGGTRSDGEVIDWSEDLTMQTISAIGREVGTDPSSPFHNKTLNPRVWQMSMWAKYTRPMVLQPFDPASYIQTYTTPPASASFAMNQTLKRLLISNDFGFSNAVWSWGPNGLTSTKETVKFGADNIVGSGIFLRPPGTSRLVAMMKSGCPWTAMSYNIWSRERHWAVKKQFGLHFVELDIGDDEQILIAPESIPLFLQQMTPTLRLKGMKGNTVFILGHYIHWVDEDNVVAWLQPRFLKTVSAARNVNTPVGQEGGQYTMKIDPKLSAAMDEEWRRRKEYFFFEGTVSDWKSYLQSSFIKDKIAVAEHGIGSEWAKEMDLFEV